MNQYCVCIGIFQGILQTVQPRKFKYSAKTDKKKAKEILVNLPAFIFSDKNYAFNS